MLNKSPRTAPKTLTDVKSGNMVIMKTVRVPKTTWESSLASDADGDPPKTKS